MAERRYNDKEIAAIFRVAAEAQTTPPREVPADEGLTLSDLQAIGRRTRTSLFAAMLEKTLRDEPERIGRPRVGRNL